ncbi:MAG: NAD(P)-binding domain-containing protein [Pseudomonadota bacterium]
MKVCVVGAGPSGLTAIKQLRDEGHEVVCYDKNTDVGGIWLRYDGDGDQMKVFDNLLLTISMRLMAYSDFPHKGRREFFSHRRYWEYLRDYAREYDLYDSIKFETRVESIERTADGWTVSVQKGDASSNEHFDAVAMCSGPFRSPKRNIEGLENFSGEIVHSSEYRNNERFRGKRVLVVGLAESGADIVREISDVAKECTLAIRSYNFVLPRVTRGQRSTDQITVRSHQHEMYRRATNYPFRPASFWGNNFVQKSIFLTFTIIYGMFVNLAALVRREKRELPDTNPLGEPTEPRKLDIATLDNDDNINMIKTWNRRSHPDGNWSQKTIFCKNASFIPGIVSGRTKLNDAGIASSEENRVSFLDGKSDEFDAIMLCTGFTPDAYSIGDLSVREGNVRNLYKHFLHPDHAGTAAFIGYVRPFTGGIPICAEMQARYFARLLSGKLQLPDNLEERIAQEKKWEEYWTSRSPRQTESIPAQTIYLDSLAYEIGCLVPMWKMILNPKLFIQLWFGSYNPSCYRIVGDHNRGREALDDLFSEPVERRYTVAFKYPLMQLLPGAVHPKNVF